ELEALELGLGKLQNALTEQQVDFRRLLDEHAGQEAEIASLKNRRSNIPSRMLVIREALCQALKLDAADLPFAGELIEVRKEDRYWEGAAERLLHSFALLLLVADAHYPVVAEWVNGTHLGDRLVYYRVQAGASAVRPRMDSRALANKLLVKDDTEFHDWLRREIDQRFDHVCCMKLDEFRREQKAVTGAGQTKTGGRRMRRTTSIST